MFPSLALNWASTTLDCMVSIRDTSKVYFTRTRIASARIELGVCNISIANPTSELALPTELSPTRYVLNERIATLFSGQNTAYRQVAGKERHYPRCAE